MEQQHLVVGNIITYICIWGYVKSISEKGRTTAFTFVRFIGLNLIDEQKRERIPEWGNLWFCLRTSAKRRLPSEQNSQRTAEASFCGLSCQMSPRIQAVKPARLFASFLQLFSFKKRKKFYFRLGFDKLCSLTNKNL